MPARRIPGYEDYEITRTGDVTSYRVSICGRPIRAQHDGDGYLQVRLCPSGWVHAVDGRAPYRGVATFVCITWNGPTPTLPPPDGSWRWEVAHRDGNKLNNDCGNVEWITAKENGADKRRHGTAPSGEGSHWAIHSWSTIRNMRALMLEGVSDKVIAAKFGAHRSTVGSVRLGQQWPDPSWVPIKLAGPRSSIPEGMVQNIRRLWDAGAFDKEIAEEFGVSKSGVQMIRQNLRRHDPNYTPTLRPRGCVRSAEETARVRALLVD